MSLYIVHVIYSSNLTKNFNFFEKSLKKSLKKVEKELKKFLENSFKKEIEFFTQPLITDFNNYLLLLLGI